MYIYIFYKFIIVEKAKRILFIFPLKQTELLNYRRICTKERRKKKNELLM